MASMLCNWGALSPKDSWMGLQQAWLRIITAFIGVGIAAWLALTLYYLVTAWHSLERKPYSQYRLANLIIRLQVRVELCLCDALCCAFACLQDNTDVSYCQQARTSLLASAFISVTTLLFWYIRETSCATRRPFYTCWIVSAWLISAADQLEMLPCSQVSPISLPGSDCCQLRCAGTQSACTGYAHAYISIFHTTAL